jgi:hypothetical protein
MKTKILNTTRLLALLLSIFIVGCESDDEELGGGTNSLYGVWVRTNGPSGDETEIAIGGISGEPENRVYMCESVGTTGLYKGYLNGNIISWDNGMADARVVLVGNQLEFDYPSLDYIIPTLYNRGSWSGDCDDSGGGGSTTGNAMFWTSSDLGCGGIYVFISNSSGAISQYYSGGTPNCGASGCANFTLPPGNYSYTASCSSWNWNGTITVTAGGCSRMRLTN